jgi:3-deoxy-D-manno-octulosonic-acid transferase
VPLSAIVHILDLVRRIVFPLLTKISEKRGWDLPARQRFPYSIRDHRNRSVVWIHAASLGEAKLLFKFLEISSSGILRISISSLLHPQRSEISGEQR